MHVHAFTCAHIVVYPTWTHAQRNRQALARLACSLGGLRCRIAAQVTVGPATRLLEDGAATAACCTFPGCWLPP